MVEGFPLGSYLQLVDYTARLYLVGKVAVSREVAAILDRLGGTAEEWQTRLETLRQGRFLGRHVATTRDRLREVAQRLKGTARHSKDMHCRSSLTSSLTHSQVLADPFVRRTCSECRHLSSLLSCRRFRVCRRRARIAPIGHCRLNEHCI